MSRVPSIWLVLIGALVPPAYGQVQRPPGFQWVDFKKDSPQLSRVTRALASESYTAIREVGISGDFALVFTVSREPEEALPVDDFWTAYNVPLKGGNARKLLNGYKVEMRNWIQFQQGMPDLAIVYLDCWECEPSSIFTAIHFDPVTGWRARWEGKKPELHLPGAAFLLTDVGDPYTNEEVDQVFAVFAPEHSPGSVGVWYRARDLASGKIAEDVWKYTVDPATGKDIQMKLHGADGAKWKMALCNVHNAAPSLFLGQGSPSCRRLLEPATISR